MPIEEVYRCKDPEGNEEWRGLHSGKLFKDSEVTKSGPFAFGNHYGSWNDPSFEEKDKY